MKLLVINWRDIRNPEAGGAEIHLHEIFKRVVQCGHQVTLLASKYDGCNEEEVIDGIKIIRIGTKFTFPFFVFFHYISKFGFGKYDFDFIIEDISKIPVFTPMYVKKPLVSIIHHLHEKTLFRELPFLIAIFAYFCELLVPLFYRKNPIITVSESTKNELISRGVPRENIKIIYNGINHNLFTPGTKAKKPLIVYVGRVKKYKQLEDLIKAFKIVKEEVKNSELIIAGRGNHHEKLKELAKKLNLDSVKIFKNISEQEKIKILQEGWIYVITSMKEGWSLSVIEANACGTPTIAYKVPGLQDSVKDNQTGLLIKNGNIIELANTINKLLLNTELREKLTRNTIKWARNFDWNKSSEKFLQLITSYNNPRKH
ncbi:MAG: glycosyltransferase family 4 protein [Candidatus Freyarchaeota archaeon]|nr:glycosyltransferase family 4 protein [Candidatus Jordarchaeia archaeon]MBS7270450.1 glycosyltransferase family 4 protein [Candidatus Jordarchaeia archaeon]MBS7279958.1 glycosyltransferase family 4 protein [Candidatus Jordarchaeia archaeon]